MVGEPLAREQTTDAPGPQKVYAIYDIREDAYWLISLDGERRFKITDTLSMGALLNPSSYELHRGAVESAPPNWAKNLARYEAA